MTPPIVKRFLVSLQHNKLLGLFTFLVVLGGAGVVAMQEPPAPVYRATGTLTFSPTPPIFTETAGQIQEQGRQLSEEMLLDDRIIDPVSEQFSIPPKEIVENIYVKFPEPGEEGGTGPQVVTLYYTDDIGERAQVVLNALMENMVDHSYWLNTFRLRAKKESIEKRLPDAERELQQAAESLDQYVRKEGATLLAVQDGTLIERITGGQQEQEALKLRLEEIETQIRGLENRLGFSAEQAYTSSALSADPIIAQVRAQIFELETQQENLSKDYKADHPNMVLLRQQLEASEKLLGERATEVLRSDRELTAVDLSTIRSESTLSPATQQLANSLVTLQIEQETVLRRLDSIKRTEQQLRQQYQEFPNKQFQQSRLAEQVALKQDLFNRMQTALADTRAAEAETVGSLSIANRPVVKAQVEEKPSPILVMAGGTLFGIIAGAGIIFVLSTLDNKLYTPQEIKSILEERGLKPLGELPLITNFEVNQQKMPFLVGNTLAYLPKYERFRSNLRRLSRQSRVVLITSVEREEGKTLTAYNLAIASAHSGKRTLLIEADLRSPSVAETLGVPIEQKALIEPLRYYGSRSDCIRLVPEIENLYIAPSPGPQPQAAAIVESSELKRLIEDAYGRFDAVIIDAPSLSLCNDALILEPLTDGIILVTRPDYTKKSLLEVVLDEMTEIEEDEKSPLLGVVINGSNQLIEVDSFGEEETDIQEKELGTQSQAQGEEETPLPLA